MSGKGFSLDRFLGIKQPAEGTAGTFQPIIAAIDHPCVAMMPGYGIIAGAVGEQNIDRMQQLLVAADEAFGKPDKPHEKRKAKMSNRAAEEKPEVKRTMADAGGNAQ